jgi:phosphoenolpyruvate synthase/pyruvate phosphate dikinase
MVDLGEGEAPYTYQETLEAWWEDEEFNSDAAVRKEKLEALQEAMDDGEVSAELMVLLEERLMEVFGDATIMTRYRSSSNAEDSLFFSGAGLYNSQSGCLAASLDDDDEGPSLCDPDQENERTLERAIRNVWEETWNKGAWDERAWFGIDPSKVAMGILVIDRAKDEQANIVGFSGNSTSYGDMRYLLNAQEGETEVVSSDPGVVPERILLTMSESGEVSKISRLSGSTETKDGIVLTEEEVTEMGEALFTIASLFPLDYEVPEGGYVIWDTEWKITSEGQLKVKQIRPFLMQE